MFYHSAAIGPALVLADTVNAQDLDIGIQIRRQGAVLYSAHESTSRIRRPLSELIAYLGRSYPISPWTGLMTGTGIVPPDSLALIDGDEIDITISSIGTLSNRAQVIRSKEPKD